MIRMILEITLISRAGAGFVYVELYTLKNSQCGSVAKSPGVALNCRNKTYERGGCITSVLVKATSAGIVCPFHGSRAQQKY